LIAIRFSNFQTRFKMNEPQIIKGYRNYRSHFMLKLNRTVKVVTVGTVALMSSLTQATDTILYDGETGFTSFPFKVGLGVSNVRWLGYGEVPLPSLFSGFSATGVGTPSLNTDLGSGSGNRGYAGYSNYTLSLSLDLILVNADFPILDRMTGFSVAFNVAVTEESSNANRAGFSVLMISDDGKGIELGFKQEELSNRIFAQSEDFTEAEEVNFNVSAMTNYVLTVQDDSYTLVADGTDILTGELRDYNFDPKASSPSLPFNPYTSPNFLFFGDDTDQGHAAFTLGLISISTFESSSSEECSKANEFYAVHDGGLNNSQFFTIDPTTEPTVYDTTPLGPLYEGYDIEGLDMRPNTEELYATSGDDPSADHPNGYLYRVDTNTGDLTEIGSTGFGEVSAISFKADGSLWGWADSEGLLEINIGTGEAELTLPLGGAVEGLTWNQAGDMLYASVNRELWGWDGIITHPPTKLCDNLPGQTEALEMVSLPTGIELLLFATNTANDLSVHAWDIASCQSLLDVNIETPYNDIEAITWKSGCDD
jgi:hypothetical protein